MNNLQTDIKSNQAQQIIKDGRIITDDWQIIGLDATFVDLPSGRIIVPLNMLLEFKEQLLSRQNVGVWLKADEEITPIIGDLAYLPIIALDFPVFTDGRHYSTAAILRTTYKYAGEIRAIGDVLRDQLQVMSRVGFNSFAVREDKDINDALAGLNELSSFYRFNQKIA